MLVAYSVKLNGTESSFRPTVIIEPSIIFGESLSKLILEELPLGYFTKVANF